MNGLDYAPQRSAQTGGDMPVQLTSQEISQKYTRFARWYDLAVGLPDVLGVKKLRRRSVKGAFGHVLEIAVGTGKNLPFYSVNCRISAVDVTPAMLMIARKRAETLGAKISFAVMDGLGLGFPDGIFDTVVSSLTLCTFPDPLAALSEMNRVCRPHGRILLVEHGRSDRPWLARWQDRNADRHVRQLGCHWNREPLELVREAGLTPLAAHRCFLGVFHEIEIKPHH